MDCTDKKRAPIEEILRLAQASGLFFADELETDVDVSVFDVDFFRRRYKKDYKEELEKLNIPFEQLLENIKLVKNGKLTLAGLLLSGENPENVYPQFGIKATCFAGNDVTAGQFIDKEDIHGKLIEQFKEGKAFIKRNLRRVQKGKNLNTPGVWKYRKMLSRKLSPMRSSIETITSMRRYKYICLMIAWSFTAPATCQIPSQKKISSLASTLSEIQPYFHFWKKTSNSATPDVGVVYPE